MTRLNGPDPPEHPEEVRHRGLDTRVFRDAVASPPLSLAGCIPPTSPRRQPGVEHEPSPAQRYRLKMPRSPLVTRPTFLHSPLSILLPSHLRNLRHLRKIALIPSSSSSASIGVYRRFHISPPACRFAIPDPRSLPPSCLSLFISFFILHPSPYRDRLSWTGAVKRQRADRTSEPPRTTCSWPERPSSISRSASILL